MSVEHLDEAAVLLTKCLNDEDFQSKKGQSKHQMWIQLCQLLSENPNKITTIKVEPIIRQGLTRFTDMTGKVELLFLNHLKSGYNTCICSFLIVPF